MHPDTIQILDDLSDAQIALEQARLDLADAQANRDTLLVRARQTGTGPQELANILGMTRDSVHKLLAKEKAKENERRN